MPKRGTQIRLERDTANTLRRLAAELGYVQTRGIMAGELGSIAQMLEAVAQGDLRIVRATDKETPMRRAFRYEVIPLDRLTATDLREIAAGAPAGAEAYRITIVEDDRPAAEAAEALYLPDADRLGIAWGADASWAEVVDVETGIELWLNDPIEWERMN